MDTSLEKSDDIKEKILLHLNEVLKNARNENMAAETDVMIQRALGEKGYTSQEVTKELLYLVSAGRVKRKAKSYTYNGFDYLKKKSKPMKGTQVEYMISDKGIDAIQGKSKFQRKDFIGGININNIQGAVAVGEQNTVIVNQPHLEIYNALNELESAIKESQHIQDVDKQEYLGDVATLKSQIAKRLPNPEIIKLAWTSLNILSTVEGVLQFLNRVQPLIQHFFK